MEQPEIQDTWSDFTHNYVFCGVTFAPTPANLGLKSELKESVQIQG